jgi:hypothetical protein
MEKTNDTRAQLRDALDRQALKWVAILDDDRTDEDGIPLYSLETKERVFKRASEWLKESKRLFPDEKGTGEGPGVTSMRAWMKDASPENIRELKRMLGLAQPAKPKGAPAPTRDKVAEQATKAEGSALRALVFQAEGLEMTDGE